MIKDIPIGDVVRRQVYQLLRGRIGDLEIKGLYWVGESGYESVCYCYECAQKEAMRYSSETFVQEGTLPEDGARFCESCNAILDYIPTDHCILVELDGYEEHGIDLDSPEDCFHASKLFEQDFEYVLPELRDRLCALGLKILEKARAGKD